MFDDIALSAPISCYQEFKERNKGKIKRPFCNVFEDNLKCKTLEDDGSFENLDEIVWRNDKNKKYKYSTIVHFTKFQTYSIEIIETLKEFYNNAKSTITFRVNVKGSMKSNHFGGNNWGRFYYTGVREQVFLLKSLFPEETIIKIDNLAPSILIFTPFSPIEFLSNNIISYRNQEFVPYDPDKTGKSIGYHRPLRQLDNKIYDKSLQLDKECYAMQFENSYNKMQRLNKNHGIKYLDDLLDYDKAISTRNDLLMTFDNILFYDDEIDIGNENLNERQREMVKYGDNHKYWKKMKKNETKSTYANRINEFRDLSVKYGGNQRGIIRELIIKEYEILSEGAKWTKLPGVKKENMEIITSTVGCNNIQLNNMKNNKNINMNKELISEEPTNTKKVSVLKIRRVMRIASLSKNRIVISNDNQINDGRSVIDSDNNNIGNVKGIETITHLQKIRTEGFIYQEMDNQRE